MNQQSDSKRAINIKTLPLCTMLFVSLILAPPGANAAAWLAETGGKHHYNALHYYQTSSFNDENGVSSATDLYHKYESINLFEYGLNDSLTLGAKYGYIYASQTGIGTNKGLTDPELLARFGIWKNSKNIFSVQPSIKIPLGNANKDRPFSTGHYDAEIRLLWGSSFPKTRQSFLNIETAYKIRGGEDPDEIKIDAAGGIHLSSKTMALVQLFSTASVGHEVLAITTRNPSDFYTQKLELSLVHKVKKNLSIQMGIYGEVFSENSARGNGAFISLWRQH
ncbi:transporter [Arenicellales bacterium nBUS_45]